MRNIQEANKTVRSLQRKDVSLTFPPMGRPEHLQIVCYTDATHASLSSGASQGAYIILIHGENGKIAPISWQSKKLCRVTKSPLASGTLALSEGNDASFLVASVVQEIRALPRMPPILCYTDNHSFVDGNTAHNKDFARHASASRHCKAQRNDQGEGGQCGMD